MFNSPEGKRIFQFGSIVLVLLGVFLAVQSIYTLTATGQLRKNSPVINSITVNGVGEQLAVPDIATFSFGAEMTSETVASAQKVVTDRINKALDILKAAGVEEKDIKTTGYNINPHYDYSRIVCSASYCPPSRATLTGYDVSQTVEVKVRDTSKAGDILGKLGGVEVTNISGLSFTIDDQEKVKADARSKAIADARSKAKKLAKDLDVHLGDVVSFNEGYSPMPYMMYAKDSAVANMSEGAAAPELPVGENTVVSNVSITYEIR